MSKKAVSLNEGREKTQIVNIRNEIGGSRYGKGNQGGIPGWLSQWSGDFQAQGCKFEAHPILGIKIT